VTWFFKDVARLKSEREGLDRFGIEHDWFVPLGWRFDDRLRLILDADIHAGGRIWPIYLQYPDFFPHTPPSVFPRGDDTRWSSHQFGPGGEFCLEYGPDNWTPDLTGIHMIQSTRRLLEGENPAPGETATVPSRHVETLGQQFRSAKTRALLTRSAQMALDAIPAGIPLTGTLVSSFHKEGVIHILHRLTQPDGTVWRNPDVPTQLASEFFERDFSLIRVEAGTELPPTATLTAFRAACGPLGLPADKLYAFIQRSNETHFFFLWEKDDSVASLPVIPAQREERRLDDAHDRLKGRKVGLVGCGSLGSKVAAMLARSGVGKFVLTDDDLLLPDNLVRNDLDWRDAGTHKAQALARRLEFVNPAVEVDDWNVRLGGQTSAASADAILSVLGQCDLIIDATANPDILNVLAAVAAARSKPIIWAEIFGGGIGGLMGRCRPSLEPPLQYMRRTIENWFGDQNASPVRAKRSYATGGDGAPLIADDADVSVIAAHAARFAIDLLARDGSTFPHSVYAIGLMAGSVFTEPFDTKPIDVGAPPAEPPKPALTQEETTAELTKLLELIKPPDNEASAPPQGDQAPQA
jgi:molybdopterin/thiamine biosynthesis adenylyltransferase